MFVECKFQIRIRGCRSQTINYVISFFEDVGVKYFQLLTTSSYQSVGCFKSIILRFVLKLDRIVTLAAQIRQYNIIVRIILLTRCKVECPRRLVVTIIYSSSHRTTEDIRVKVVCAYNIFDVIF